MALVRFPGELPPVKRNPEPLRKVIIGGLVLLFVVLVFVVVAALAQM